MSVHKTILIAALAAPLAWAQPAPPALTDAPASPAAAAPAPASPPAAPAATPGPARPQQPELSDLLRTRVEQVKRGNRVSEVRVTGPAGEPRYSMDVGDGRVPEPRQAPGTGLSTPNFLKIEF